VFAAGFVVMVAESREYLGNLFNAINIAIATHAPLSYWVIGVPVLGTVLLMTLPGKRPDGARKA
jgi:hypothetical protein